MTDPHSRDERRSEKILLTGATGRIGRVVLEDAETGEIVEVGTGDPRKRAAFAERQARAQAELARLFRSIGIDAIHLRTDQPYTTTLGRFFETRERRRLRG